MTCYVFVPLQS